MGPGHFGVALAAKTAAPKMPLWVLLVASEALDLLCFGFVFLGIEKTGASDANIAQGIRIITPGVIPWSHGLLMALVWSAAVAGLAYLLFRSRRMGMILGMVVFSHWVLDFIVHLPDLPLFFDSSPKLGLGLWGSGPGLILSGVLEVLLITGGLVFYIIWRRKPKHAASVVEHQT